MSDYEKLGNLILIGYCFNVDYEVKFGKIKTSTKLSKSLETSNLQNLAMLLKVMTPEIVFCGNVENLEEKLVEWMEIPSKFGGLDEGVVIKSPYGIFKHQQSYQLDKEARYLKKMRFKESLEFESEYWKQILEVAKKIADSLKKSKYSMSLPLAMNEMSSIIRKLKDLPEHPKKSWLDIKDDVQINAKNYFLKSMPGNNGSLILGKFRVLTNGHFKMISKALEESDYVYVAIVSKDSSLQRAMISSVFPDVRLIDLPTGNVNTALRKIENINTIWCGTDRVETYSRQVSFNPFIRIREIYRTGDDISATKVLERLDDKEYFESNTPIVEMYEVIREIYKLKS